MSIVANRYENVRAALCLNEKMAKLAIEHNNANVIVLGSRLISFEQAIKCLNSFLSSEFKKGRHELRIKKFSNYKL
jgi:ribose 5-phosphate isomerase B